MRRSARGQRRSRASSDPVEDAFDRALEGALLGAVEAGRGDRGDHDRGRAGHASPSWSRPRAAGAAPSRPSSTPKAAEPGEHPEVDREDLAPLAPLLDPEEGHHRQRVGAVDEGGDAGGVRVEADGDAAAGAVDDLQPDERRAGRSRPASGRAAPGRRGGRALAGDRAEAAARGAADRPPGVEGPEDVAEQGGEEGEAEPGGDEEEGEREVAVRALRCRAARRRRRRRAGRRRPAPQRAWAGRLSRARESPAPSGRQCSRSKRGLRQAAESAKKETIRTIEAPQAKSQAGIGRSCLATSACANGSELTG